MDKNDILDLLSDVDAVEVLVYEGTEYSLAQAKDILASMRVHLLDFAFYYGEE